MKLNDISMFNAKCLSIHICWKQQKTGPGETVETFFRERMASCFGHQSLTIARGRGGKYPSQREQWQLHGEVGDR